MSPEKYIPEVKHDTEWFKQESVKLLGHQLQRAPYPGYPGQLERFATFQDLPVTGSGKLVLPDGVWCTDNKIPTSQEYQALTAQGLSFDQYDRPLHPWLSDMIANTHVGVVTGRGFYWQWGPNYTADPIIIRRDLDQPHVLLITRQDTGQWALPGGFVDKGEAPLKAALREAGEEALIDLTNCSPRVRQTYHGPLADIRVTANAWPETTAFAFELPNEVACQLSTEAYQAGDDAAIAQWVSVNQLDQQVFGSHKLLIQMALV